MTVNRQPSGSVSDSSDTSDVLDKPVLNQTISDDETTETPENRQIAGKTNAKIINNSCDFEGLQSIEHNHALSNSGLLDREMKTELTPKEIERKDDNSFLLPKTGFNSTWMSFRPQLKGRARSDSAFYKLRRKEEAADRRRTLSQSTELCNRLIENAAGISENPDFFSTTGEWTVVDLDILIFEKEEANRTMYLRKKGISYREVEPERICKMM